jgi:glycosyltransferase involved in cell wall biosynthesis
MATVAHYLDFWLEYSSGFIAAQIKHSRHRGVVISRENFMYLDAFPYRPRHRLHLMGLPGRARFAALDAQLTALLALQRADLLHVHFGTPANDVLRVVRRGLPGTKRSWPYVLSLHGTDVTGLPRELPDHYDRVVDPVDAVIVPSRFLRERAVEVGFEARKITVIPSGVDTQFFTPTPLPDGPPVVAFVGRLIGVKGVDVLLQAWPQVRSEVPAATLQLLGYGELAARLAEAGDSVIHIAPDQLRRHTQVKELLRRATVLVSPSRVQPPGIRESLLLVNLEAAASGRPVVSTLHGGIPEYVADGQTGLLVAENDPSALADALVRILSDGALAKRLGTAAAAHVRQWDVRRTSSRVDEVYDRLLKR